MEAVDQQRVTIEKFLEDALRSWLDKVITKADDSNWWTCVLIISLPFYLLAVLLYIFLNPIVVCVRLAVTHADRVVFVLASSFLSFYQVPRNVFYIDMAVLAFTGFLQFLRYHSGVRFLFLVFLSSISCGTSNIFLRKFTTLHSSNPFNRCFTTSQVVYVPIGSSIHRESCIEVFDFPVSEYLIFDEIVGYCKIKIETLDNIIGSSTIRDVYVDAPWGEAHLTVNMENDNLGRLLSYFNRVTETNYKELICTTVSGNFEALSILGAIKHFNSELELIKVELRYPHVIL